MDNLQIFIDIVNDYIAKEDITIHEFAKRICVAESAVIKWLDATYFPAIQCAVKVADLFNCSLNYLFGLSEIPTYIKGTKNATFLDRFELLRTDKKLTSYRVAKNCNFGQSMISKWKNGKYPKTETLIKIAKLFDCSIDYLIGRSDVI